MKKFLITFLVFLSLNSYSQEKTYVASFLTQEPVLDGELNEPFWKDLPEGTGFLVVGKDTLAKKQTSFRIGYNDEAIYLGIICQEPEIDKIKTKFKDMEDIWKDDGVEIFIYPKKAKTYFQFIVNVDAFRFNTRDLEGSLPLWDWSAKVFKGKDFYSLEIKIPFEVLLMAPLEENEEWRLNIGRNDYTSTEERHTAWPYLTRWFHEPENFGKLILPKEISKEGTEKIKLKLLPSIQKEIASNIERLSRFKETSAKRKERHFIKKEFDLFLKDYENLKKSFKQIEKLSLKEIIDLSKESEELLEWSRKLRSKMRDLRDKKPRKRFLIF